MNGRSRQKVTDLSKWKAPMVCSLNFETKHGTLESQDQIKLLGREQEGFEEWK